MMVAVAVGPESGRGRKRKRNTVQNVMLDIGGKKKVVETRPFKLVGRYVQKEFQGSGVLLGKIMLYDSGLYRIKYEDGRREDMINSKVKVFLIEDGNLTGEWIERIEMLNELLSGKDANTKALTVDDTLELENANPIDSSLLSEMTNCDAANNEVVEVYNESNGDVYADSLSGSSESTREGEANVDMEVTLDPPPELPPSSGHIGVPEEYVSYLLSVYSFLRSFSVRLFLYPFGLDDFVGALNCSVANTLLDSVHVALMRVLKRQFERLLSDGSELAVKILGCLDWSLLDTLTWPIYLVHYLKVMGYNNGDDWKKFYAHCLERDYYTSSASKKLVVMQILCEEVLATEELRTEMDMREESEVGVAIDTNTMVSTICEPRKVHPRYSGTSACKDIEAVHGVVVHSETKSSLHNHFVESQVGRAAGSAIHEDGNDNECRLCGMDGFLVCCDGCPSSYHSRCLGMSKMSMPDGLWYCPECKINASEPKTLQGTTLTGGDIFGIDPYKQVFVASCDHLLVFKASINSDNGHRYYNRCDISGVLHALYSRAEHAIMYSEICRGIIEYWKLSPGILPCNKMSEICLELANKEGCGQCNTQLVDSQDKVPEMSEVENHGNFVTGGSADIAVSQLMSCAQKPVCSENSMDIVTISGPHIEQQCEIMKTTMNEPALFSSLIGQPADPCELNQQNSDNRSQNISSSRNSNIKYDGPLHGSFLDANVSLLTQELHNRVDKKSSGSSHDCCLYMGSSFRTTGYINHYFHGDFAASAAANLAILSCKENQARESGSSDKHREVVSASIALEVKAFSSAAMRFFWPNAEKKLVEAPRERCGWCSSCKAALTSKKGCLLNAAASNAIRGAAKVLAGVCPVKNGEDGRLSGIVTYIIFVEESLSGLLVGPFRSDIFRKQWRKKVEQATTCNAIKILLLELEKNISPIALSGDWMKLVEGFSAQSSTSQIVATAGSTQKHRPGRRGRKHSVMAEVEVAGFLDTLKLNDFTWWRGGGLSKLTLQRGILSCSIIKRSARQGGRRKIPGIFYLEGNEAPRSNRQLAWRSAVDMSRNVAQLALQVRYLDFHVRWGDLVCPEQTPYDRKGPEAETSVFRNAYICDKKIVEHKIRYCIAFGSQKHLPSRVMKNITEKERILDDGKGRYWFSESYIPLYLIKEYELKEEKNNPVDVLSKLQRRELKASCENIFSFLLWKQENKDRSCSSCHQDVFYRNAVNCSACQEFCHGQCATRSAVNLSVGIEFIITCKQCCETKGSTQVESNVGSSTSPFLLQGLDSPNPATATKHVKLVGGKSAFLGPSEHSSEVKLTNFSAVTKKNRESNWGLKWRKKNCEDTGFDFRLKNILLRGNVDMGFIEPLCRLCNQPYNADLMYIRCDTCKYWFHADSVELDESKIFYVVGFKCCKCRRIKSPLCPYSDPVRKKALEDKIECQQAAKLKISTMDLDLGIISYNHNGSDVTNTIKKMQKIRRSLRRDTNLDRFSAANSFSEVSTCSETNAVNSVQRIASREKVDFGASPTDCLESVDTELKPLTMFSFNESLEPDANGNGPPENVVEIWRNPSWYDEDKHILSGETGIRTVPCNLCSSTEHSPDLCCQICGMWIHRLCSPWFESSSDHGEDDGWRCGSCRDWR